MVTTFRVSRTALEQLRAVLGSVPGNLRGSFPSCGEGSAQIEGARWGSDRRSTACLSLLSSDGDHYTLRRLLAAANFSTVYCSGISSDTTYWFACMYVTP